MDLLPSEVLWKIFRNLPYKDLNNVILVCRRFKQLAEDPLLWRNFHFQINAKICEKGEDLDECLLETRRLGLLSHVLVWGYGLDDSQIADVFSSLRKKRSISHIRFTSINLSNIDKDILSSFLTKLTAVILDLNYLTLAQTAAIFCKLTEESSLKHLDISYNALVSIPDWCLGSSVRYLQSLRLIQVQISDRQLETLLIGLTSQHSLLTLELQGLCLDSLDTHLFGRALSSVRNLILHNTFGYNVTSQQLETLFSVASHTDQTILRHFHLILGDLVDITLLVLDTFLLSGVRVRLTDCTLSDSQYKHFSQKEGINISDNFGSLQSSVSLTNFVDCDNI